MGLRRHASLALLTGALLDGCTFLALDEFEPARCTTSAQCEVLNTQAGISATACQRYQCARQERTCRLLPRDGDGDGDPPPQCNGSDCDDADPRRVGNAALARALCGGATTDCCDGVDNNCNGVIDEGQWRARAPQPLGPALEGVAEVTVAGRAGAAPAVFYAAEGGRAAFGGVRDAMASFGPLQFERQWRTPGGVFQVTPATMERCPGVNASGTVDDVTCTFGDVVGAQADAAAGRWFVGAVNVSGCAAGDLRFGHFDESNGRVVLSDAFSNIATGVDSGADSLCTGSSRMPPLRGASRPALAALEAEGARPPEALAAWLARPINAGGCGAEANVEALGLWLTNRRDEMSVLRSAVRGTDGGRPLVLGMTRGGGRPAVAVARAAGAAGYVVGYGAAAGGVALQYVPAFEVAAMASDAALGAAPTALVVRGEGAGPGDHAALAVGAAQAGSVDLGVAWREGCEATGAVWFAVVRLEGGRLQAARAAVRLATAAAGAPSVGYADAGMVRAGYARDGMTATEATDGGWVVTWPEGAGGAQRVVGRRVLELDGRLIEEEPLVLAEGLGGTVSQAVRTGAPAAGGRLAYVVYGGASGALTGGELLCRMGP